MSPTAMSEPQQTEPKLAKRSAAIGSVSAAALVTLLKLVTGLLTGSLGMLSEAAHIPDSWYLSGRVISYADELAELSEALVDPLAQIRPASAVALHLLLTQAVDSPLYNPAIPAETIASAMPGRINSSRAPWTEVSCWSYSGRIRSNASTTVTLEPILRKAIPSSRPI